MPIAAHLETQLTKLADRTRLHVLGLDLLKNDAEARLCLAVLQAYGDADRGFLYVTPTLAKAQRRPPDLVLGHPCLGLLIVETKGHKLDEIEGIEAGYLHVRYHNQVKLKRIRRLYTLRDKPLSPGATLDLDKAPTERYQALHTAYDGLPDDQAKPVAVADISYLRQQRRFSRLTLVAEIARYLNKPCLAIEDILEGIAEGTAGILAAVNQHNELLYDWVIPRLFAHLYEIKQYSNEEEEEIELVKQPEDGYYTVSAQPDKLVSQADPNPALATKSFHLDHYVFDSNPEHELFWRLLRDGRVKQVYFTGMLTHGQSNFYIQYIDPETNALRTYYPDFIIQKQDGSWVIVEVKGDHMLDNGVIQAKANFASQMAVANGMKYKMMPSSQAKQGNYDYFFNGAIYPQQEKMI